MPPNSRSRRNLVLLFLSLFQIFHLNTAFNNNFRQLESTSLTSSIRKLNYFNQKLSKNQNHNVDDQQGSYYGRQRHGICHEVALKASPVSLVTTTTTGLIQQGFETFLRDWKIYSAIPLVAAFVGWFTNYLAVQMIFYPIKWRGIPFKRVEGEPLGFFGWQGIVPAKTKKMSEAMVNVTINELLSMEDTIKKLEPERVADILSPEVPEMLEDVLEEYLRKEQSPAAIQAAAKYILNKKNKGGKWLVSEWLGRPFLKNLTLDMQQNIVKVFNVMTCVTNKMMADRTLLGKLFQKTGGKELKFLTDSGLWFGFLLGCLQMLVNLYFQNPWTLSVGGLIVGLATNWLALKWIFEPIEPTRIGPFVLQGMFLKRQKQVAEDFSEFFANRILNSKEIWKSILSDPTTSPSFRSMFARNLVNLVGEASGGVLDGDSKSSTLDNKNVVVKDPSEENLNTAVSQVTFKLPYHLQKTSFHSYVDRALGIKATLRTGLENLSSKDFEQVLHPIFEEDELTLILAGGFLGFLAGFIQQLFATGAWTIPSWSTMVAKWGLKAAASAVGISFFGFSWLFLLLRPTNRPRRLSFKL